MKNIYNLKLHEECIIDGFRILRVPGGWLYKMGHPVFVPFNNEFDAYSKLKTVTAQEILAGIEKEKL